MSSISKNIGKGIFYTALSRYSRVFISIFIGAVLARLLSPAEFGIVAMVSVFLSFFNLLSNFGIGPAVVQNKDLSDEEISSIFSFSILFGLTLAIIFYLAAPLIASYYNNETIANIARVMSLAILFQSLQVVPSALNRKKLRFKQIGIISVSSYVISGIIAIILAYKGFSYYALVINSIISGLLLFSAYYFLEPIKITFIIHKSAIKKIAKFSTFQFFFSFINYFSRNADNLLIGKYFNMSALGLYDKSYKLMMMPVQNLTHVITPVLHPVLSKHQDDKKVIYNAYSKIVKLLAIIGFPLSVYLYFNATEIITIMYGAKWIESIPVFKLLALTVAIQIVLSSTGSIFQATNRTDLLFYAGLLGAILMLSGIGYGIFIGKNLVSVGYGLIIAFTINFLQALLLLVKYSLGFSYIKFLKIFIYPIVVSFFLAVILFFISLNIQNDNLIFTLLLKTVISIIVFGLFVVISKEYRNLLNDYLLKKIRSKKDT